MISHNVFPTSRGTLPQSVHHGPNHQALLGVFMLKCATFLFTQCQNEKKIAKRLKTLSNFNNANIINNYCNCLSLSLLVVVLQCDISSGWQTSSPHFSQPSHFFCTRFHGAFPRTSARMALWPCDCCKLFIKIQADDAWLSPALLCNSKLQWCQLLLWQLIVGLLANRWRSHNFYRAMLTQSAVMRQ